MAKTDNISLEDALSRLSSDNEITRFLTDLCTPAELNALRERWLVAQLLDDGSASYRDINAQTGISTTTIGRVARCLKYEPQKGYQIVLDQLSDKNG